MMKSEIRSSFVPLTLGIVLVLVLAFPANARVGNNRDGILNPNLATQAELGALPHLDAGQVQAILDGRPFANMLEVNALLSSLSEARRAELYARLFLPLNLNATTEEEILLVPGVGARMAHEFDEYKPYAHLAVFRREMGKYVDDEEVARLEQFVFVPVKLNAATDEDILTIPGLGNRMLREFREYRPYTAIAEFRREMGKYVDDDEVARLERYVVVD
jgi:DNA uptake protein ComE-like DNA-binding protein